MDLFIKYQLPASLVFDLAVNEAYDFLRIPSDLLSFSDETGAGLRAFPSAKSAVPCVAEHCTVGDAEVAPAQRLEMVKGHVKVRLF